MFPNLDFGVDPSYWPLRGANTPGYDWHYPTYVIKIPQRHGQPDWQTDCTVYLP